MIFRIFSALSFKAGRQVFITSIIVEHSTYRHDHATVDAVVDVNLLIVFDGKVFCAQL